MEDIMEIMKDRHSVRKYIDRPIERELREQLNSYAEELNRKGNLNIQIIYGEPECFNTRLAHYGRFSGCSRIIRCRPSYS